MVGILLQVHLSKVTASPKNNSIERLYKTMRINQYGYLIAIISCLFIGACFFSVDAKASKDTPIVDEAAEAYKSHGQSIYQIQVVDRIANKKSSIGSGFQISDKGHIATNYHVVSEAIQRPKQNRVEYLTDKGERGALKIILADVVHDLAIVQKVELDGSTWLELGKSELPKGARIFSLGNPHDIGFTIIEGTYNGISDKSLYEKIHFSGSLNPGMSGGPAINHDGEVIGVNVSTAGNQISFLVPVEHLKALYEDAIKMNGEFSEQTSDIIEEQLEKNQKRFLSSLIAKEWKSMSFGPVDIPAKISDIFKCWGGQVHEEKDLYKHFYSVCSSQDDLYLEYDFSTGLIQYKYEYLEAEDELNTMRFYKLYSSLYGNPSRSYYNNASEQHVTNFSCNTEFVDIAGKRWKSSFCLRKYKKYPKLLDMNLYMAMVGEEKKGLIISLMAQGIDKENSFALSKKFMQQVLPLTTKIKEGGDNE